MRAMAEVDMRQKRVVITGANSGIGLATARALASMGAEVILTARDANKGAAALEKVQAVAQGPKPRCMSLDLASFASIRRFVDEFSGEFARLDVLINNAGLILTERRLTEEGFEYTFGVNHLGHFLLTQGLLPRLEAAAPARVVTVASEAHRAATEGIDFDDLQREGGVSATNSLRVYGISKLANICFSNELARRVADRGVTSNALHPGTISSGFGMDGDMKGIAGLVYKLARPFMPGPDAGAKTSVYCASAPELDGVTGKYFERSREKKPTRFARNPETDRRLWELSERWVEQGHP